MTPSEILNYQAMVASASRQGHIEKLLSLEQMGCFDLRGLEAHEDLTGILKPLYMSDFNGFPRPFPVHWALACLIQNKALKPCINELNQMNQLNQSCQVYALHDTIPQPAMSTFISERVDDLHAELERRRQRSSLLAALPPSPESPIPTSPTNPNSSGSNFEIFKERYNATLHQLLCASAALKDPVLAQKICRAFDDGAFNSLKKGGGSGLVQQDPLFNSLDKEKMGEVEYASAAFVAMMFESIEVIDVMLKEGWSPVTCLVKWEVGHSTVQNRMRELANGKRYYLSDMPAGDDVIKFSPLVARKCFDMLKVNGTNTSNANGAHRAHRGYAGVTAERLHKWAIECFENPEEDLDAIYLALEMGVYDIKPNESYAAAAERGIIEVIEQLGARLDWSLFTPKQNPILHNLNSGLWNEHSDEMATVCMTIFEQTVAGGRPDLVRERNLRGGGFGDFIETPLLRCVENRFDEGVVFCLEQGADPDASVGQLGNGKGALETADQSGDVETATLIRSFQVRKAAREAIGSIGSIGHLGLKP